MFINTSKDQMVNLDNVDTIWKFYVEGEGYEIRFIKYIDRKNHCVVGTAMFDTKEEMEKFVDKKLKPLTYNPLGDIEFYLEEISKNVGM